MHGDGSSILDAGPVPLPADWARHVGAEMNEAELEALRRSAVRGCPFGESSWVVATVETLGLQTTIRARGRPRKQATADLK